MPDIEPIILHGARVGPNPVKVIMILEELELPYDVKTYMFDEVKKEPFISINPNGRLPAIEDPNTGITLWESGAIIEYLVDTYDKDHKLSFDSFPERYHLKQWLYFQTSGQGPYYGQLYWFKNYHPDKVESVISRYEEQTLRVMSVLDRVLEGREYLVGNKCTYADLAFITWELHGRKSIPDIDEKLKAYPNYVAWFDRISSRPRIAQVLQTMNEEWMKIMAARQAAEKAE